MREYLFRGKKLGCGEWIVGNLLTSAAHPDRAWITESKTFFDGQLDGISLVEVDPATVGQYTGLTDKNGVKIFEGDIVRANIRNGKPADVVIYESAMFKVFGMSLITWAHPDQGLEVIGNIYDDPELVREA